MVFLVLLLRIRVADFQEENVPHHKQNTWQQRKAHESTGFPSNFPEKQVGDILHL